MTKEEIRNLIAEEESDKEFIEEEISRIKYEEFMHSDAYLDWDFWI